MGASAAKLLVYYHPDAPNAADQERFVADVAAACRAADLALFVEPLSFSLVDGEPLVGEARRRVVVETARRLTAIGGDILKAEFPYDPSVTDRGRWREACAELDAASALPWVLLSGGVDDATFEAQVATACRRRRQRRARRPVGLGRGRAAGARRSRRVPGDHRRARGSAASSTLADAAGRPWHERPNRLTALPAPGDGWYREY